MLHSPWTWKVITFPLITLYCTIAKTWYKNNHYHTILSAIWQVFYEVLMFRIFSRVFSRVKQNKTWKTRNIFVALYDVTPWTQDVNWTYMRRSEDVLRTSDLCPVSTGQRAIISELLTCKYILFTEVGI